MHWTKLLTMGAATAVALALAAPGSLTSAATPADVIAQRKVVMSLQGAAASGIQQALKAGDLASVAKMADSLEASGRVMPSLFEQGTGPEVAQTRALPAVWEKPEEFKAAAMKLVTTAAALEEAAKSGDQAATTQAFATMGKEACGGCHGAFRAK